MRADSPRPRRKLHGLVSGPGTSPPGGWASMTEAQRRDLLGGGGPDDHDGEPAAEALEAGFTHHLPSPGATGFAAGGPLDVMLGGSELAWHAGTAWQRGLGALSDAELCGAVRAAQRLASWASGMKLAAVAELDARRARPDGREGEHVTQEAAALLRLTGRAAASLVELSRRLQRLPATAAMLAAGLIDRRRAAIIADHTAVLSDEHAVAVQDAVLPEAPEMTTAQLAAACRHAVAACDPAGGDPPPQGSRERRPGGNLGRGGGHRRAGRTRPAPGQRHRGGQDPGRRRPVAEGPRQARRPRPAARRRDDRPAHRPAPAGPAAPRHRRHHASTQRGRRRRVGEPDHARRGLARPLRRARGDPRDRPGGRRHLPRPGRRARRQPGHPLVPHHQSTATAGPSPTAAPATAPARPPAATPPPGSPP